MDDIIKELLIRSKYVDEIADTQRNTETKTKKSIIFALGDKSRKYFEDELSQGGGDQGIASSIQVIWNSENNIDILFLDKLQYLFMYLTKFEVTSVKSFEYQNVIIFGLDDMIINYDNAGLTTSKLKNSQSEDANVNVGEIKVATLNVEQLRLLNLIYNIAYKTKYTQNINLVFVPVCADNLDHNHENLLMQLQKIQKYWESLFD
ncbi:uncharacterized protein SCODWIG_01831 [Saccharomycodes ludwigii]|uniref:Uncharacterized protein n=1 Tax=Saccharomycodes ludwigii TaxID=36035 RepID=A0A376B7I1_9ASCO|nr:hypothetical protein SCDLUD_004107 [Saccharomycodes ludwigii]KAH3899814.1 hypothetical protein SCDLUD_004107 [Saccharomycodes ludwigii]SSD60070.1 uncharacterized protein SCODWIG_01831 [Saccharomycodes ludwigii]